MASSIVYAVVQLDERGAEHRHRSKYYCETVKVLRQTAAKIPIYVNLVLRASRAVAALSTGNKAQLRSTVADPAGRVRFQSTGSAGRILGNKGR